MKTYKTTVKNEDGSTSEAITEHDSFHESLMDLMEMDYDYLNPFCPENPDVIHVSIHKHVTSTWKNSHNEMITPSIHGSYYKSGNIVFNEVF